MEHEHTIAGLCRKRAEIAGQLEATQLEVRRLIVALDGLDTALRVFDPTIDLDRLKVTPPRDAHIAGYGQTSRHVLALLRETALSLTTSDITQRVMVRREMDTADARLCGIMMKRVGATLRDQMKRGVVAGERGVGRSWKWRLAPA